MGHPSSGRFTRWSKSAILEQWVGRETANESRQGPCRRCRAIQARSGPATCHLGRWARRAPSDGSVAPVHERKRRTSGDTASQGSASASSSSLRPPRSSSRAWPSRSARKRGPHLNARMPGRHAFSNDTQAPRHAGGSAQADISALVAWRRRRGVRRRVWPLIEVRSGRQ